jgi:hypothetical protein
MSSRTHENDRKLTFMYSCFQVCPISEDHAILKYTGNFMCVALASRRREGEREFSVIASNPLTKSSLR